MDLSDLDRNLEGDFLITLIHQMPGLTAAELAEHRNGRFSQYDPVASRPEPLPQWTADYVKALMRFVCERAGVAFDNSNDPSTRYRLRTGEECR